MNEYYKTIRDIRGIVMNVKQLNKENTQHGMLSNFWFMLKEQLTFDKKPIFVWILRIFSELVVSLLVIYFPKVVLDSIGQSISSSEFIFRIGILTIVLIIFKSQSNF